MIKANSRQHGEPAYDLEQLLQDYLRFGRQAVRGWFGPSLEYGRALWSGYAATQAPGACCGSARPLATCEIPETDCPPRCVCDLNWQAHPRDTVRGTIRVVNTGEQVRRFNFVATSLRADGHDSGVQPHLEPAAADLAPQESVTVHVSLPLQQGFETGRTYRGEVLVRGLYEQCVRLAVQVEPEPRPHCEVRQGEMPMRIRAHRWYHHFQCEEPCFEPIGRVPRENDDHSGPADGRARG